MAAQFNENNKKLGRDTMHHAEQANHIASEQGDSRKHHASNKLGSKVGFNFDILRQKRWAAAHVGLDASQCYNRIVHAPAALCMIQHGAHEPAVQSMFGVLQAANNKVATAFGTSKDSYGGSKGRQKVYNPGRDQDRATGPAQQALRV